MKMLQLLVVVLIASSVLVSPEPTQDEWLTNIQIFPTVKTTEADRSYRVRRSAEPIGRGWPTKMHVYPSLKAIHVTGKWAAIDGPEAFVHRVPRRASTCMIPKAMEDSLLECKMYPSRIICYQTCMFGYTLKEGIQRKMECNLDEDRWRPVNRFENCKPFVDCTLTLGPGGRFKCHSNFLDKGAHCDVSCEHFEDKAAVDNKIYVCDINGDWAPELPFCAIPGTGIKLTAAPNGPKTAAEL